MDAEALLNVAALARKKFDEANAVRYNAQVAHEADPANETLADAFALAKSAQDSAAIALGDANEALGAEITARAAAL